MSERPMELTELFVQKANKHRIDELRYELEEASWDDGFPARASEAGIDPETVPEEVRKRLQEARQCALDLLIQLGEHEPEDFNASLNSATALAQDLVELMEQARDNGVEEMDALPTWRILSSVVTEVAEPHIRNLFLFECAALMARADGELSSVETGFLHSLAEKIGLPAGEAQQIIRDGATIDVNHFRGDPEDAFHTIHQLYLCALADGVVQGSEKRMLHRVASSLGVPDSKVDDLLYGEQKEKDVDDLDKGALKDFLLSLSDLPEHVYRSTDLNPDKREALRSALDIPPDEETFLMYENRFLGELLECSALTGRNLWVAPPDEDPQALRISNIDDWYFGMRSTQVQLDDGTKIRLSRDAREYLQLVQQCLNEALTGL